MALGEVLLKAVDIETEVDDAFNAAAESPLTTSRG